MTRPPVLIVHVVYRFDVGGLENGVVNLINRLPVDRFRHVVVALTNCVPEFCNRIEQEGVEFISLDKSPGHGVWIYRGLYRLFRDLRPDVVHTRNLAALEAVVPAWCAGVPLRIHGEHGWDVGDLDGSNRKNRTIRRLYRPFVSRYVALSSHLRAYLVDRVGVPQDRVERICNGVDTTRFRPSDDLQAARVSGMPFDPDEDVIIGTVGRLQPVKDQLSLIRALADARQRGGAGARLRLIIAGDGPLREELEQAATSLGLRELVWFAGERQDVPDVMRAFDVFALPSKAEGISNTILEAMASGLPVLASTVGGNPELVDDGRTGTLFASGDVEALASGMLRYASDRALRVDHGQAGRRCVEERFSLDGMVRQYADVYDRSSGRN